MFVWGRALAPRGRNPCVANAVSDTQTTTIGCGSATGIGTNALADARRHCICTVCRIECTDDVCAWLCVQSRRVPPKLPARVTAYWKETGVHVASMSCQPGGNKYLYECVECVQQFTTGAGAKIQRRMLLGETPQSAPNRRTCRTRLVEHFASEGISPINPSGSPWSICSTSRCIPVTADQVSGGWATQMRY